MHFNRYIAYWARRKANRPVLTFEGQDMTWAQLDQRSARVAAAILARGVQPGDRVGCLLNNDLDWCVIFVAVIRAGAIFVPLNPMFGPFELAQISADADCALVFSCPDLIGRLGRATPPVAAAGDDIMMYDWRGETPAATLASLLAADLPFADHRRPDDDPIVICYTSGTTGTPKGILLTHRSVDAMVQGLILNFDWAIGEERFLILAPLAFTGTVICLLAPMLAVGAHGFLERRVDPARALDLIVNERITYAGGVPAIWERIAAAPGFAEADISCLRAGNVGGAPVPRPLLDAFQAKGVVLKQQYGTSEASGAICSPDERVALEMPEACGHPLPTFDLQIRDAEGRPVADGEVGEICIRGPQMMQGYWRKPEETARVHWEDWYRTGDLGRYDPRWGLFVVDRIKNMLISGGVNVYPAEVERAMMTLSDVEEVVVFGMPSAQWGDEICGLVFAPSRSDAESLIGETRELLGAYKAPRRIILSPTPLPRTATGKLARTGVREFWEQLVEDRGATRASHAMQES